MTKRERITKETFESNYCGRSNITRDFYNKWFTTLPCACDYEGCRGWAAVRHGLEEDQIRLYAPRKRERE